jgi:exopolysaccharide biosynthesis polyprenyl glycosylphosphotransferase
MSPKGNWIKIGVLLVCDAAAMVLAFWLTYYVRAWLPFFVPIQPLPEYVAPALVLIGLTVLIFAQQGLYRDVRDLSMLEAYAKIIKSVAYAFLLALVLTFFFKVYERSRVLVALYWAAATGALLTVRFTYYRALTSWRARGRDALVVAVAGSEKKVKATVQLLKSNPQLGYRVKAGVLLPHGVSPRSESLRRKLDQDLIQPFRRGEIAGVILSDSVKNYQHLLDVSELLDEHRVPHRSVTEAFDLVGFKASAGEGLEGLLQNLDEGQAGGAYEVAKRFLDEIVALAALAVSAPLWMLIVIAIKLDSAGPVFFKQERVGYHGRRFWIYKFRSMRADAPRYAKTPHSRRDPRITRVGAFLRRTSLDELPQLLNVIKGDMSLVGPRPEMPFIVEKYKPIHRYRLLMLPGLTGLWQVSGRTDKPLEENIKYDLYYLKNRSLLLDVVILLRTVPAVLFGRGAY